MFTYKVPSNTKIYHIHTKIYHTQRSVTYIQRSITYIQRSITRRDPSHTYKEPSHTYRDPSDAEIHRIHTKIHHIHTEMHPPQGMPSRHDVQTVRTKPPIERKHLFYCVVGHRGNLKGLLFHRAPLGLSLSPPRSLFLHVLDGTAP